ncbi:MULTISPECIES: DnaB-like helicase C-terminal domain-containing protein [Actinosynnema]|uniref:SF4 helicase domain-containing protein n=1 Tax=Actinosynnema pretiosum TaxID=42197 RepID=A0A290ZB08_9PSEU|nr:DnaB-like helicase C-terminal domain-containing protein [Actinosynnema pretiosum]ATE56162.1 hypothetical protein CNX65_25170 [Actinosynnema pretiosum]MCP2098612.1 replicative DNA helicase [Actinosynnema pretiosum]
MTYPDTLSDPLGAFDAELYLIGLLQPVTMRTLRDEALSAVDPRWFADPMFGAVWAAARALRDDEQPISARTLLGHLRDVDTSPNSVARAERLLSRYAGYTPPAAEYPHHVAAVVRCGRLRELVAVCDAIKAEAVAAEDPAQALGAAYDRLAALDSDAEETTDVQRYGDLLDKFVEEQRNPSAALVIPTPWIALNDVLNGGLRAGRVYVIGARPGDGKSISAHQMAHRAAELGHPAVVFSAEMGAGEVTDRMVSSGALVEQSHITRRRLDQGAWSQVNSYVDRARHYPLSVVDRPNLTVSYIKAVCRNEKRRKGLDVVVIDYLQLVGSEHRGARREEEVAAISRQLKQLSRELGVAVIIAAQLNRESVRNNRRPVAADLRESGGIEADADVVILHSRPVIEEGDLKGEPGWTVLFDLVKNRIGRAALVELDWRAHYATIGSPQQQARLAAVRPTGGA